MPHGKDDDYNVPPLEGKANVPEEVLYEAVKPQEPRKPHRKISWVAALVAGLVVVFVVAVLLLATLFTNYRRGTKLAKVISGSEKLEVNIYTTEEALRKNGVDLFESQDRVQQVFAEMGVPKENVVVTIYLTDRMTQPATTDTQQQNQTQNNGP